MSCDTNETWTVLYANYQPDVDNITAADSILLPGQSPEFPIFTASQHVLASRAKLKLVLLSVRL